MRCGKIIKRAAAFIAVLALTISPAAAADKLMPGGMPFGVRLCCDGVLVVGVGEVETSAGRLSPARDAGIRPRDVICEINGVCGCSGEKLSMLVRRSGGELTVDVLPVESTDDGKYRAGLWIRDSTAGIGTVTFIDPSTGAFAGLGHGICDSDTGGLMPLKRGAVLGNTECGVYGVFSELPNDASNSASVEAAESSEVCEGDAELWCTVDSGGKRAYKVRISDIDRSGRDVKNFVVTVTDDALIEKTGGIVQGMSGSPILQNGKLIGAVTHVMINDPSRGYGIFIENMLDVME